MNFIYHKFSKSYNKNSGSGRILSVKLLKLCTWTYCSSFHNPGIPKVKIKKLHGIISLVFIRKRFYKIFPELNEQGRCQYSFVIWLQHIWYWNHFQSKNLKRKILSLASNCKNNINAIFPTIARQIRKKGFYIMLFFFYGNLSQADWQ